MLVSVLLPTRNRILLLQRSLHSLHRTADLSKDIHFEIIVRCDEDDAATQKFLEINPDLTSTWFYGPRRRGYADLHTFYNDMCEVAKGRFLFLWNDDAEMLTPGWDLEIARHDDGKPCYLTSGLVDGRGEDSNLFPIVHRSWFETTGHFSASPHNDTYIYNAFKPYPQLFRRTDIVIRHRALQNLGDLTSREAQRWWPVTKNGWDSEEVQNALGVDTAKLGELVKQHGMWKVDSTHALRQLSASSNDLDRIKGSPAR